MDSLIDELYNKIDETRTRRPAHRPFVACPDNVERPEHHGKRPRNQHENGLRGGRGTAAPGPHVNRPRTQGCGTISQSLNQNEGGNNFQRGGAVPRSNTRGRGGTGRARYPNSRSQSVHLENQGIDHFLHDGSAPKGRGARGMGRPWPQKNRSRSQINDNKGNKGRNNSGSADGRNPNPNGNRTYHQNRAEKGVEPRNKNQRVNRTGHFSNEAFGGEGNYPPVRNPNFRDKVNPRGQEKLCDDNISESGYTNGRKPMGYRRLQELSTQSSSEVVMVLANSHFGFEELVKSKMRPDLVILIMKVLAKACQYEMRENKTSILATTCHSDFLEEIRQHLCSMLTDKDKGRISKMEDFIDDILIFFETVMKLLPNTASEKFEDLFKITDVMMNGVENYQKKILTNQKETFLKLKGQLDNMIEERNREAKKIKSRDELLKYQRPPDDFREKSVFPTVEDIFGEAPFIRPNIVDGAYEDVEHYLDIQFRLLREDFVAPLREGITQFVHQTDSKKNEKKRIENVRIYRNVIFGDPKVINDQVGVIVHFDPEGRLVNMKWEYSKRFMFGSLLCFSNNNFQNILFGTVLEREMKDLKNGQVIVLLCNETEGQGDSLDGPFVMAESETYFEPYQLVLRALQGMTEETFPMYQYIIAVEKERHPPLYLEINPDPTFNISNRKIRLLDWNSWPGEKALQLDSSQYEAFRAALTEEFVVIQGPPGTGKTFLGLKVAKALLENSSVWNAGKTPILVVCYTNHALDQFLEGLLLFTDRIVRVGGQSKSEKLASHNLKEKRKNFHRKHFRNDLTRDLHDKLLYLMTRIKTQQTDIEELQKKKGVLKLEDLKAAEVISDNHLRCFRTPETFTDLMVEWLGEGFQEMDLNAVDGPDATDASNATGAAAGGGDADAADLDDDGDEDDQIRQHHDRLFESCNVQPTLSYSVDIHQLEVELSQLELDIEVYPQKVEMTSKKQNELFLLIDTCNYKKLLYKYWKTCLQKSHRRDSDHIRNLDATRNLWQLSHDDRWILYKKWVNDYKNVLRKEMQQIELQYRHVLKQYAEAKQLLDFEVMQEALVVGMTTTMSARMQPLLQALKPKIVIVEEAAEVLESHIVVSLTKECQHLILIGDHQQLRPSTTVYRLAVQFHFDVSLFERMVKNDIHHHRLGVQHRMRPEIARLIVPAIYPELLNHPSVQKYPQVKGVTKSLFFVSHSAKEEEVQDIKSHQNVHEAEFVLHLCRYFLQQGYQPDDITILTTYKGQMFFMKTRQRRMEALRDVKVTVVDNFQGEENKIILLSLVRSNEEAKVGFLKIENRVCVALSRAKEGMFIIGNMGNLTEASGIWRKVKRSLEEQDCFGTELTLQCSVHPHQLTKVSTGSDFVKSAPEGGCSLPCDGLLECGHRCQSVCHVNNRHHKEYKCHEKCDRNPPDCPFGHLCIKLCYLPCGKCETKLEKTLPCGHVKTLPCYVDPLEYNCRVVLKINLPHCQHLVDKPCFKDIATFPCPVRCEDRLPCGHSCVRSCHALVDPDHLEYTCMKPCAKKNTRCSQNHVCAKLCHEECGACQFDVKKKLACGHQLKMKCSVDPAEVKCKRKCEKILPCKHRCRRVCYEECGGCQELVLKKIPECGHELRVRCSETPHHVKCRKKCEKKLRCGHDCMAPCGLPCSSECFVMIISPIQAICGHAVSIPCSLAASVTPTSEDLLGWCRAPCGKALACEHMCKGSCGQCLQGRIHAPCGEKCDRSLICGHKCKVPCAAACPPCGAKCTYRCQHSRCPRKCGEPCAPCKEPCGWHCEHSRCSKLCHEICNREPCCEPCKRKLKCGHDCIGFCGDPCPPLCRICNKDEVTEVFFGNEDEEDARFVLLVDCKHILESEGLKQWMGMSADGRAQQVAVKTCPKCKSDILTTERFMNDVKMAFRDVQAVKQKIFGAQETMKNEIKKLQGVIASFMTTMKAASVGQPFNLCIQIMEQWSSRLQPVRNNRRNYLNRIDIESLNVQVEILMNLDKTMRKVYFEVGLERVKQRITEYFIILLNVLRSRIRISGQETQDFNKECSRFFRMTQLAALRCSGDFQQAVTKAEVKQLYDDVEKKLYSIEVHSSQRDREVKTMLDQLAKACHHVPLSDQERKEIVRAMGMSPGHWFKCPNGHFYAIGDCGGAMEVARCPECKERIGGGDHRLLGTNALASEMDGATRPAWPGGLY